MSSDGSDDVREFRLEGVTLFVAAGVLLVALGGAFMLGRWVERGRTPASGSAIPRKSSGSTSRSNCTARFSLRVW